ncbi:MAG: glycosyltransferase family 4 protein [Syntrophobacteraceae bacterium]
MARILLLSLVFAPDGVSTSVLMSELALELREMGHEITVLTTTPHYNLDTEARNRQPLSPRWPGVLFESTYCGIPVFHVSTPSKASRVGARLLDYARFHAVSTAAGLTRIGNCDVIIAPSPPLTIGLSAWLLGVARDVPFVYNVQEIYPDVAVSLGLLTNRKAIGALEMIESFIYRRSRVVTVISEWFRRRLLSKGVSPDKIRVIPNFVDTDFVAPGLRNNQFSTAHGLAGKFVILYAGNIGLTQGFETILEAAESLRDQVDLRFVIVGDGARRNWLEREMAERRLSNVLLLPYQSRSLVPMIYASADICLVPLKKGTARETFPSKIYTIMASARPVIASADPDSELVWVVGQAGCGWAVPPDNAAALKQAIQDAYGRRQQLSTLGACGRDYVVANHSRRAVARQYNDLVRGLVDGR